MKRSFNGIINRLNEKTRDVYFSLRDIKKSDGTFLSYDENLFSDLYYFTPQIHTYAKFYKLIGAAKNRVRTDKEVTILEAYAVFYDATVRLAEKLNDLKQYIVKGRKPSQDVDPEDRRTIERTGTCGICGQNVKLDGKGLWRHGYTIKNWGFQKGNCFGTGRLPIEVSDKAVVQYIEVLENNIAIIRRELSDLKKSDEVAVFKHSETNGTTKKVYHKSDPLFELKKDDEIRKLESEISHLRSGIREYSERVKQWHPMPLPDGNRDHMKG
jgi:hypothetical protein